MLDFDGTLSEIADDPRLAEMLPEAHDAVRRLHRKQGVDVVVISGRALHDVRRRAGIEGLIYAGNHGMEIEGPGVEVRASDAAGLRPTLDRARVRLSSMLGQLPGVLVEDKGLTLSVHYRMSRLPDQDPIRKTVMDVVGEFGALRVTEGKKVLEVRPKVDIDKGTAVHLLLDHLALPAEAPALYIGDDVTDEDAFRALRRRQGATSEGILVGERVRETAATGWLANPFEVASFLDQLAAAIGA